VILFSSRLSRVTASTDWHWLQLLRKVHRELSTEMSPPKSVDPLTVLPRELAEQILNYLNFKQLMNTCLVSKEWAQFIRRTPNLWRHLDLTLAKRKVKNAFISRAINVGRSKLKVVTLRNLFDFDLALAALTKSCPLEEINMRDTGVHTEKIVGLLKHLKNLRSLRIGNGTKLSCKSISAILQDAAATVEALYVEDVAPGSPFPDVAFSNMRELDLAWSVQWPSPGSGLQATMGNMPNLRSLKLHHLHANLPSLTFQRKLDLSQHKHLTRLDLVWHFQKANEIALPPSLTYFALGTWRPKHAMFFDNIEPHEPLQWPLPSLEELKIRVQEIKLHSVEHALRPAMSTGDITPALLHTLSITSGDLQGASVKDFLSHPRLREVKHLTLRTCHGLDDDHMSSVASCLPLLQSLDVSGTDVTGAGIKDVIKNGLKKLVVNDCRYLGLDAVHWARNQGVKVEYRSTDATTGGKKLRY
jgi:F-box/TPR repeat protein Pof3